MLSVPNKPVVLSVIKLSVVTLNVVAPDIWVNIMIALKLATDQRSSLFRFNAVGDDDEETAGIVLHHDGEFSQRNLLDFRRVLEKLPSALKNFLG
jgi:hypothetical protein